MLSSINVPLTTTLAPKNAFPLTENKWSGLVLAIPILLFEATEILLLLNMLNEWICNTSLLLAPEVSTTLAPFVAV